MNIAADMLTGKRALITGATGGMGQAIVESLLGAGIRVIAHGRSEDRLKELAEKYSDIIWELADFNETAEIERLADRAIKHYGGLDILINNAGIVLHKDIIDLDISVYDAIMDVNLRAVFILSKIIGKKMIEQRDGYIINIGSGASTTPIKGLAAYCASKHGLLGFSESLALEMRQHGVKVSIVMPGSTATGFGGNDPGKRLKARPGILLPEDIANMVMYLLTQPKRAWTSQVNLRPLDPDKAF